MNSPEIISIYDSSEDIKSHQAEELAKEAGKF
jgi:hypothetical protein